MVKFYYLATAKQAMIGTHVLNEYTGITLNRMMLCQDIDDPTQNRQAACLSLYFRYYYGRFSFALNLEKIEFKPESIDAELACLAF
jgi:hypothetical protein